MKKLAILFAMCAMAIIFSSQDAMAQHRGGGHGYKGGGHGYRGGHGHRHGGYYGGNRSSFAIAVGGPSGAFSYGSGYYGRPVYGYGYGVPVAPVVPVYGGYGGYGYGGGWGGGYGGGCRGGGGGVFIGW